MSASRVESELTSESRPKVSVECAERVVVLLERVDLHLPREHERSQRSIAEERTQFKQAKTGQQRFR